MTMPEFDEMTVAMRNLSMKVLANLTNVRLHLRSGTNRECEIFLHPRDAFHVQKICYPDEPFIWGQKVIESDRVTEGEPLVIPVQEPRA